MYTHATDKRLGVLLLYINWEVEEEGDYCNLFI